MVSTPKDRKSPLGGEWVSSCWRSLKKGLALNYSKRSDCKLASIVSSVERTDNALWFDN